MATSWPKKRRLLGTKVRRIDGPEKATGKAKYSLDINRPGMVYGMFLRSPYAHAKIKSIDISPAEKMPGVKAVVLINNAKEGKELFYAGDEVAAVAADTEEHALDALRAIKVEYDVLDHFVYEEDALKEPTKKTTAQANVGAPQTGNKGDVEAAYAKADAVVEGTYGAPTICHQCLEPHGLVAEWDSDGGLTVWASTQATVTTAQQLSGPRFGVPATKVKCITHYVGGGFGSKFGPDIQGFTAVELAKKAGAPVKFMFDRAEEVTTAGNRPSVYGTVKIAGMKDGSITAFEVDCHGTGGALAGGATVNFNGLPYIYLDAIPNWKRKHTVVRTNAGGARAMRAPGHPQSCLLTEFAVDDLAAKLDIDPLIVRRKNLPPNDPAANDRVNFAARRNDIYNEQLDIAVKLSGWKEKWHRPGAGPGTGPVKHGLGMAIHTWGGYAAQLNHCTVIISRDGSVTAESSTQDLGTGQRTVTAVVVAEILGLQPTDIITKLGESQLGASTGSGGSTTCPSQAPATLRGAEAARDDLFAKVGPRVGADPKDLTIELGKVVDGKSGKSWGWKEFCARLGMDEARGRGDWSRQMADRGDNPNLSSGQVGGVQVAEVTVDTETGVALVKHMVAVQDCGLVVSRLTCESQVAGGVIMGLNYALFEERIMDRATGRQVNPDMEFYKLGGMRDMPKITVHLQDMPERGVIGIGEPPTVSTAAAIGNAVFNAIGARVPVMPMSPKHVLDALVAKGGKA
jgi:xanthine dehydrogenase YagR molybdenum-binding subunit